MSSINANDYLVTSVRYNGTDEQNDNIALRRISSLENVATNDLLKDSYIVLADPVHHKNYKKKLGDIIDELTHHSDGYTNAKITWLKNLLENKISEISTRVDNLQEQVDGIPSLEQIRSLISADIADITSLLDSKANTSDVNSIRIVLNNVKTTIENLHSVARTGDYTELNNKPNIDAIVASLLINVENNILELTDRLNHLSYNDLQDKPNISEEINDIVSDLQSAIDNLPDNLDQISIILQELEKKEKDAQDDALIGSRLDDFEARIKYLENFGGGGNNPDPGPTPSEPDTPVVYITYKFWILSANELSLIETEEFKSKQVKSTQNSCPFTNEGYNALYYIKNRFGYNSNITKLNAQLYLILPTKYSKIQEGSDIIKINGKSLAVGVFAIHGNELIRTITIDDINYNLYKISNDSTIGNGIELTLI